MKKRTAQQPAGQRGLLFLWLAAALLAGCSCSKNSTGPQAPPTLSFTVEAGVIEAWLTVQVENAQPGQQVVVTRNGQERLRIALSLSNGAVAETTVVDTGLQPAHSYSYAAALWQGGKRILGSETATAATLDTTSHDFSWEIFEFGGVHGSSVLNDVAIINENDIWAVGEIHTAETDTVDSLGNWVPPFNAVHWDGSEWELRRFMVPGPGFGQIYSVYAFGPNDVWMGQESARRWDGQQWIIYSSNDGFPGVFRIREIWGTSSENLYFVGDGGNIVHYNGRRWRRIESGTEIDLTDIWGSLDGREKWACGWGYTTPSIILKSSGNAWETVWNSQVLDPPSVYFGVVNSLWINGTKEVIVAGGDIFRHSLLNPDIIRRDFLPWENFTFRVRGSSENNIFMVGEEARIQHWNGVSWHNYPPLRDVNGELYSLALTQTMIVAVGTRYSGILREALIITGRR